MARDEAVGLVVAALGHLTGLFGPALAATGWRCLALSPLVLVALGFVPAIVLVPVLARVWAVRGRTSGGTRRWPGRGPGGGRR